MSLSSSPFLRVSSLLKGGFALPPSLPSCSNAFFRLHDRTAEEEGEQERRRRRCGFCVGGGGGSRVQMSRLHFPYLLYFYATLVYGTEISLLSGVLCLGIVGGVLRPSSLLRIVV